MRHLALILALTCVAAVVAGPRPPDRMDLSRKDRQFIERFFGKGVVGEPVDGEPLDDVRPLFERWAGTGIRRVVHGDEKGKVFEASLRRLDRDDAVHAYQLDTGGPTVLYASFDANGNLDQYATADRKQGVITQYDPPVPVFRPGTKPGFRLEVDSRIEVFDLTNPKKRKHTGRMKTTMEHLGFYRVTVPAGTYDTAAVRWTSKGKVGPAEVNDISYWFFAASDGPVAWINKLDVSAFLVYNDKTKRASVLVSRTPAP